MQRYQLRLSDYNKSVRSQVYELQKDDRLREIARRELGMQDSKPFELEYLTVPGSLLAKYKAIDVGREVAVREEEKKSSGRTLRKIGRIRENVLNNLARTSAADQAH